MPTRQLDADEIMARYKAVSDIRKLTKDLERQLADNKDDTDRVKKLINHNCRLRDVYLDEIENGVEVDPQGRLI